MQRMQTRALRAFLLASAFAAPAAAEEELIVVANRLEIAASDTPAAITVIDSETIARRQVTSVFEALRGAPGVTLTQNGGPGQPATVRIRGSNDDQTLVLVDGVPVNDPSGLVGYDFAFQDTGAIERIEVLRGAGSAIWGSDAIGGVVNVVTFKPGETSAAAYAEAGSFNTGRIGARAAFAHGGLTLSAYANAMKTDGISAADEDDGNSEEDGADRASLGMRAHYALTDALSVDAGHRATEGRTEFDQYGFVTGTTDGPSVAHSRETQADARATWRGERFGAQALISRSLTKRAYDTSFPGQYRGERTLGRLSADAEMIDGHTVLGGVEHEKVESESLNSAGESDSNAAFLVYRGHFGERILIEAGVRHEEDDRYGDSTTPRVGAAIKAWSGATLKANWGQGYKAPTVDEVTGGGFTGPNENLEPEESTEWDVGVEQVLLNDAVKLSFVYFDREVDNLIQYGFPSYTNTPAVTDFTGVEAGAEITLGAVDLLFAYTRAQAETRSVNRQINRVPEDQASLDMSWSATDKLLLGGYLVWNGEENDVNTGPWPAVAVVNDAWTKLDLRAAYQLQEKVELYGRVENVTDEDYQDIFGYGVPGRAVYAGLRVRM